MTAPQLQALIEATKETQARQQQIDENLATIKGIHDRVRSHRWRYFLNRRLLAESRRLLNANQRMTAMNNLTIMRNAAYLAGRR